MPSFQKDSSEVRMTAHFRNVAQGTDRAARIVPGGDGVALQELLARLFRQSHRTERVESIDQIALRVGRLARQERPDRHGDEQQQGGESEQRRDVHPARPWDTYANVVG